MYGRKPIEGSNPSLSATFEHEATPPRRIEAEILKRGLGSLLPSGRLLPSGIAAVFWALAVVLLCNAHWLYFGGASQVRPIGYAALLVACLTLLLLARWHWQSLGMAGALLGAALTAYLFIGVCASLLSDEKLQPDWGQDVVRQIFFALVLLAAAVGAGEIIQRSGVDALAKGILAVLVVGCAVILASPLLRIVGILPSQPEVYPLSGAFTDPSDAGFVGAATVLFTLALLRNGGDGRLGYLGLGMGFATIVGSLAGTAAVATAIALCLSLADNRLARGGRALRAVVVAGAIGLLILAVAKPGKRWHGYDMASGPNCSALTIEDAGLARDCATLLAIRDTLAGDATLNWRDSRPISSWRGVGLGGTPERVVVLDLAGPPTLTGRIPPELGNLDNLYTLALHLNQLVGPIPPELGALRELRHLNLSGNRLSGAIPPELGDLALLEELKLRKNELTGVIPAELGQLRNLRLLALSQNALTGAAPNELGDFANIMELRLQNNERLLVSPELARRLPERTLTALGVDDATGVPTPAIERLAFGGSHDFLGGVDSVLKGRVVLWWIGLDAALGSPWIGNGFGRLKSLDDPVAMSHRGEPRGVHDVYLMLAGEAGVVPVVLYVLFLFALLRLAWTAPPSFARDAVLGLAVVVALFGLTYHQLLTKGACMFLLGVGCALAAACERRREGAAP